ncbi:uncharacterized protein LOC108733135 [Agrilus planipennis]|uniref:Uncharacterized protein LOC108733135 n=1 Tax=Agrilus planipennis TaxID=224129 RepID=A0A7F5RLL6_AGRPL|nr:uncharacterized protein LOC108733135 [Agrilus planipennis]
MCSANLRKKVDKLQEEFETFGITKCMNQEFSDKLLNVLDSTMILVNFYRKSLSKIAELELDYNAVKKEKNSFLTKIASLENKVKEKENSLKDHMKKIAKFQYENEQNLKQIKQLEEHNNALQNRIRTNENLHEHKFKKLLNETQNFVDQKERNFGHYVSRDETLSETIYRYKKNEEVYKETIQQLQNNNNKLLREILILKQDILRLYKDEDDIQHVLQ